MRRRRPESTRRPLVAVALTMGVVGVVACEEQLPTSLDDSLLPEEPVTVEIELPWSSFGSGLEVFGGYGAPRELGTALVAKGFAGTLDARSVIRYGAYPDQAPVRDTTGAIRTDTDLTYIGGRLVAWFDTLVSTNPGPVTVTLGALQQEWDAATVTWDASIDTINDVRAWPEPGAGPVAPLDTAIWDPAAGDSVWFELDSATVAAWADTTDLSRGGRIDLLTDGFRLRLNTTLLRLDVRPSVDPDTVIVVTVPRLDLSFVYDPLPLPPPDGIRVGGVPAWRTVMDVDIPDPLTGPPELCAAVACPLVLEERQVNYAALVLKTRSTEEAFRPTDTLRVDVRPVLERDAMPKSPLGASVLGALGRALDPSAFGSAAGLEIEVPITSFVRALVAGAPEGGQEPTNTLALLSVFEPVSFSFASFHGAGGPDEPYLKLVLTIGPPVELP